LQPASLAEARARVRTRLFVQQPSPEPFDPDPPPGVERVTYTSQGRELVAWLVRPPGSGTYPGLLYAHAGFALGAGDVAAARPFVEAGYVVLLPAWRGENGNPGNFEMYYGEVDDAQAALEFLAQQVGVDRTRLFAAGHDTGGTIVMLLAMVSDRLRAAAACGGIPDMRAIVEEQRKPAFQLMPFDWRDPLELDLRSPARHLRDLRCPLYLFYGERQDQLYYSQAAAMQVLAEPLGKLVRVLQLPGTDHNTAIDAAVPRMIRYFARHLEEDKP
jgi:dipeptidyl aminopeptidase/acylaminoacyl peptidase